MKEAVKQAKDLGDILPKRSDIENINQDNVRGKKRSHSKITKSNSR